MDRPGEPDSDQHQHRQSQGIDLGGGVQGEPTLLARSGIAVRGCHQRVAELVDGEAYDNPWDGEEQEDEVELDAGTEQGLSVQRNLVGLPLVALGPFGIAPVLDRGACRQEQLALRLEQVSARLLRHQVADISGGPYRSLSDQSGRPFSYAGGVLSLHHALPK